MRTLRASLDRWDLPTEELLREDYLDDWEPDPAGYVAEESACTVCGEDRISFMASAGAGNGLRRLCKFHEKRRKRTIRAALRARTDAELAADCARLRPDGLKRCRGCRADLPVGDFPRARREHDGLQAYCTPCHRAKWQEHLRGVRREIWQSNDDRCTYCGRQWDSLPSRARQVDHAHPVALGGTDDPANLFPACGPCNGSKSDRPLDDWLATRPTPPPSAALDAALAYARAAIA